MSLLPSLRWTSWMVSAGLSIGSLAVLDTIRDDPPGRIVDFMKDAIVSRLGGDSLRLPDNLMDGAIVASAQACEVLQ